MPASCLRLLPARLTLLALVAVWLSPALAADRYVAWLADGKKITTGVLPAWPVPGLPLKLENQDLWGAKNPVRLVRDRSASIALRPPFLVLANGDVLTGTPTQLEPDQGRQGLPTYVKVQLEQLLPISGTGVAVRTDRIARIVNSSEAAARAEPPPGTVELADGRRLTARSIRWREYGLSILTSDGIVEATYAEIADAVFAVDRTAAVLDDSDWASSTAGNTIARFQMTGGSIITTSRLSRETERSRGSRRRGPLEVASYYYVQPAWAEQSIALPEAAVAWCGYRDADEAPLSLLPAQLLTSRRLIGTGEPSCETNQPTAHFPPAASLRPIWAWQRTLTARSPSICRRGPKRWSPPSASIGRLATEAACGARFWQKSLGAKFSGTATSSSAATARSRRDPSTSAAWRRSSSSPRQPTTTARRGPIRSTSAMRSAGSRRSCSWSREPSSDVLRRCSPGWGIGNSRMATGKTCNFPPVGTGTRPAGKPF